MLNYLQISNIFCIFVPDLIVSRLFAFLSSPFRGIVWGFAYYQSMFFMFMALKCFHSLEFEIW